MKADRKVKLFLSWWNEFLTIERFAEYYGLDAVEAEQVINEGRKLYNKQCEGVV